MASTGYCRRLGSKLSTGTRCSGVLRYSTLTRFTMVYTESPDMSDTSHDFAQPQTGRGQPPSHRRLDEARMTLNRNGNNHNGAMLEQYGSPVPLLPPQDPMHRDPHTLMPPVAHAGSFIRHRTDFQRARFAPYPRAPAHPPLGDSRQRPT